MKSRNIDCCWLMAFPHKGRAQHQAQLLLCRQVRTTPPQHSRPLCGNAINQQKSILRYFIAHYEKAHNAAHLQMFVSCLGPLADPRIEENINQGVELRSHGQHRIQSHCEPFICFNHHAFSSSDWFPSLKYWKSTNVYEMVTAEWSMAILHDLKWNIELDARSEIQILD